MNLASWKFRHDNWILVLLPAINSIPRISALNLSVDQVVGVEGSQTYVFHGFHMARKEPGLIARIIFLELIANVAVEFFDVLNFYPFAVRRVHD